MIRIFSSAENNVFKEIDRIEPGAWVHLLDPTEEELVFVRDTLHIEDEFIRAALDEEETVRIDAEEDQTLVLVDIPIVSAERSSFMYTTLPMGIIITADNIITVCLEETSILEDFWNKNVRGGFDTCKKNTLFYFRFYIRMQENTCNICVKSIKHPRRWKTHCINR